MPGESPSVFGDALRRLGTAATYLYQDGPRYWYSTQPTVTKLAEDRAEQLKREPDKVVLELDQRLRANLRKVGDFSRVHALPQAGQDVPDEMDARLVVLGVDHAYSKEKGSAAELAAKAILESRGSAPRLFRNTLVFLAVDQARLQDLDEAIRRFLAWDEIVDKREELDLSPHQVKQAEEQRKSSDGAVTARLPEAYQWLLVPVQATPQAAIEWQAFRLSGQESLAVRASKKLRNDELLVTVLAGTRLRMELDRVPLWRGENVPVKQLAEDFARYLYLPRLKDTAVLFEAIGDGVSLLTWEAESFAYADSFDEAASRYRGLRCGVHVSVSDTGLVVGPKAATKQRADARAASGAENGGTATTGAGEVHERPDGNGAVIAGPKKPTRYHGAVTLDPARVGRDAGRVADEVVAHLVGLVGAKVRVTLEIEAEVPSGAPDQVVRTVTENGRTLKFTSQGFENE
jgi:hypothetical protein